MINLKENKEDNNEIIYNELLEAEKEMECTTERYSIDEVLQSINNIIEKY